MAEGKEVVLITGCSGRIGFKAAEKFSEKYQVVGFDVLLTGKFPGLELVSVDMGSDQSVKDGLEYVRSKYGNKLAAVIHLAAYYNFTGGRLFLFSTESHRASITSSICIKEAP